jgi:protein-disulfide isomerase
MSSDNLSSDPSLPSTDAPADAVLTDGPAPADAPKPTSSLAWLALWAPTLLALAASSVLLVDYVRPAPVFCAQDGGCDAVKHTSFAYPGGLPMPAFGVAGFLVIAALLFVRGTRARALQLMAAGGGAIVGAFLLALQLKLGTLCPYCIAVDSCAILGLGVAYVRARRAIDRPTGKVPVGVPVGLMALCVGTPAALGAVLEPQVPAAIRAEIDKAPRGQATIVDFVDFQCPFCRQTHKDLAPLLAANKGKVRVVRKHVPLMMHMFAQDAARAACCGEQMGKGDELADALVAAPLMELTPDGCAKMAAQLGLDDAAFRHCMSDPATDEHIERDRALFHAVGGEGLPTLWVGTQKVEGAQGEEVLRRALDAAIAARAP